jgi:uncharacterized membrane protein YphA (DoxX/SURF4 family)
MESNLFYRVDYQLALLFAGLLTGLFCGRRVSHTGPAQVARVYHIAVVVLLVVRVVALVGSIVQSNQPAWILIIKVQSDMSAVLFGALFGVALRRANRLELLREPAILSALCLAAGFGFMQSGYTSAVYMQIKSDFFIQCGYSVTFLKFIMTIEVLGGMALLVPWAVPLAAAGLSVDMFGAIATHIHNGDPINDSTGAISQLIRLGAIAVIWALRPTPQLPARSMRKRFIAIAVVALLCVVSAAGGSHLMRRSSQPAPAAAQSHS